MGGPCTGGSFMGKNCMSFTLLLKFRRQHIKYKHTVKISKAYSSKNNFALFNCLISLLNFKIYFKIYKIQNLQV